MPCAGVVTVVTVAEYEGTYLHTLLDDLVANGYRYYVLYKVYSSREYAVENT